MIRLIMEKICNLLDSAADAEWFPRGEQIEVVGTLKDNAGRPRDVIMTVTLNHYIPKYVFGEGGYSYMGSRKRKIKDKETKEWKIITEDVERYEMSEADMKFVYNSYVNCHLTQRQIAKLGDIPEPYVTRYIKHKKMKPRYPKVERSQRVQKINLEDMDIQSTEWYPYYDENDTRGTIPEDFSTEPFHLDPFPTASEWKARREDLGLKNGENWRNTPLDENPGPRQYGDGSKSARRNLAKLARKEKRKKKNINKFNSHQNNRYGITPDNPEGTKDPYKQRREELLRKKNLHKGNNHLEISTEKEDI